jgi:hypothetical protein
MTTTELEQKLYEFIQPAYPEIAIKIEETTEGKRQLFFTEEKFKELYPQQRYHYLLHRIPGNFFEAHLTNTVWFELAPGENPEDLEYPDNDLIKMIRENVLLALNRSGFTTMLDNEFISGEVQCHGDYRNAKRILAGIGFADKEEQFDIFHVLMDEGGYCDCEILYNAFRETEYAKNYWSSRK